MKKITKKQSDKFHKAVEKLVLSKGFNPCEWYKWEKDTQFGMVRVTVWDEEVNLYSVFSCFDEPERAKKVFNCGITGKYNVHCSDEQETLRTFEYFLSELESLVNVDRAIRGNEQARLEIMGANS
jgi:hypothetical protein